MGDLRTTIRISESLSNEVPSLMQLRKCTNLSEYIRELIKQDIAKRLGNTFSMDTKQDMEDISNHVTRSLENSKNEILQRVYIQTKITLELFSRAFPNQLPADQIQDALNRFVDEAGKRYPVK